MTYDYTALCIHLVALTVVRGRRARFPALEHANCGEPIPFCRNITIRVQCERPRHDPRQT